MMSSRPPRQRPTAREYSRYWFDNLVSKGLPGMLLLALIGSALILLVVVPAMWGLKYLVTGQGSLADLLQQYWTSFVSVFKVGNGRGDWTDQLSGLLIGIIAIFFTGTVFGAVIREVGKKAATLRERGGQIIAHDHTVIIGWSPMGHRLIEEIAIANENQGKSVIAILTPGRKSKLEDDITAPETGTTKVLVRSGKPTKSDALDLVRTRDASRVIVLGQWGSADHDEQVVASLMSLARYREKNPGFDATVVACIVDSRNIIPARVAAKYGAAIIDVRRILSRMMLQMCLQPGLYAVYAQMLSFDGDELYFVRDPKVVGRTFGSLALDYPNSTPVGIATDSGAQLHPDLSTVIGPENDLIVLTRDDDTAVLGQSAMWDESALAVTTDQFEVSQTSSNMQLNGWTPDLSESLRAIDDRLTGTETVDLLVHPDDLQAANELASEQFRHLCVSVTIPAQAGTAQNRKSWLFLGWSETLPDLLRELDAYGACGEVVLVVRRREESKARIAADRGYSSITVEVRVWAEEEGARVLLDDLGIARRGYVVIFTQDADADTPADGTTLLILLQVRDILSDVPQDAQPVVVTELLDDSYRKICESADAKDIVVNSEMVALMLAQLSEDPELLPVFEDLCDADGSEVYIKPAARYVKPGLSTTYATVVEAARRRGEIALGYRLATESADAKRNYGVHLNPPKAELVVLGEKDGVIVISEDGDAAPQATAGPAAFLPDAVASQLIVAQGRSGPR